MKITKDLLRQLDEEPDIHIRVTAMLQFIPKNRLEEVEEFITKCLADEPD